MAAGQLIKNTIKGWIKMGKINVERLKNLVENGDVETVIVAGVDMQGKLFGKRIPARYFLEINNDGVNTCALNYSWDINLEFVDVDFCNWNTGMHDIRLVPDLSTLRLYPWSSKTAFVLTYSYNKDGSEVTVSPRNMLKKQLKKLEEMGMSAYAASEFEFYVFKETSDTVKEKNYYDLKPLSNYPIDYSLYRLTVDDWFLGKLTRYLEGAGVPVETLKGEWGNGQIELNIRYAEALEMADRSAIYKTGVKEIAALNELLVTFMAKYSSEANGSSGHTHISLWDLDGKKNLFFDPDSQYQLSEIGRYFLGGMLELAPEMMLFYAPYINSYKRLSSTEGSPNTQSWGLDNRSTSFRLDGKEKACRIENRIPGADVNHYLVLTAMLASGMYGIKNKIDIPEYVNGDAKAQPLPKLPNSLMEAVQLFEKSNVAKEFFGKDVVNHYLTMAKFEINEYLSDVTDWERRKYLEFI